MTLWEDIYALLYPARTVDLYKDKKPQHRRSTSRTVGSEGGGSGGGGGGGGGGGSSTKTATEAGGYSFWSAARPRPRILLQSKFHRFMFIIAASSALVYLWRSLAHPAAPCRPCTPASQCECGGIPAVADPASRAGELADALAGYKHRGSRGCDVSSLNLHRPFGEACGDRTSALEAMSSGGRAGRDAPYLPRGCDMRWFTTAQACEVLGRFDQVVLVGDSMLRHVIGALNVVIREDLGYGGVTDWNFSDEERENCFCNSQFNVRDCSMQGIYKTADVLKHDPASLACPKLIPDWKTDLRMEQIVRYPIPEDEQRRLSRAIGADPSRRKAFVLGHGLWNNLDVEQSTAWMDAVLETIDARLHLRTRLRSDKRGSNLPILLVTPNAAGDRKPDEWLVSQGNKALVRFERAMAGVAARRRIDHLGTWNMSVQATLYDGVHMDMRGNLLKAMMVLNWLDLLET